MKVIAKDVPLWFRSKFMALLGLSQTEFSPNWVSRPGDSIKYRLEKLNIPLYDFAQKLDMNPFDIYELLSGRTRIDETIATRLADILGGTPEFWVRRDQHYFRDCKRLGYEPGSDHP